MAAAIAGSLRDPGSPNDHELASKAVRGDLNALSTLLERHGPSVQKRLQIGSAWQAVLEPQDVMQVTFLEAFLQIGSFDPARSDQFMAWLDRIAQNNLRDAIRGLQRLKQPQPAQRVLAAAGEADSYVTLLDVLSGDEPSPSRRYSVQEAQALLNQALDRLPADYATVVRLYDLQGKTIQEVCASLGKSTGAVHMLRARAHDRLRALIGTPSMFFTHPA